MHINRLYELRADKFSALVQPRTCIMSKIESFRRLIGKFRLRQQLFYF